MGRDNDNAALAGAAVDPRFTREWLQVGWNRCPI